MHSIVLNLYITLHVIIFLLLDISVTLKALRMMNNAIMNNPCIYVRFHAVINLVVELLSMNSHLLDIAKPVSKVVVPQSTFKTLQHFKNFF